MEHEIPPVERDVSLHPANNDIPEEPEGMSLSDDNVETFAPPPRIAARFYRPSASRRKSSAASSRRNSISSTHSQTSNRSFGGRCQNHHVAQHLRRASILESRKARLADRAAHAEQVRLRAALQKAAPRSSNSEERALAAQQAREKHLAQVAAACAEEVRRAKKVAEEMKERKAAEEARNRLEMEEKHAEAKRRREEHKRATRRPRTTSVPSVDAKKPTDVKSAWDDEAAVKTVQALWRTKLRKRTIDAFLNLGISIDKIHDTTFEDISALLAEERVLTATTNIVQLFKLLSNEEATTAHRTSTRKFLSAYLVLGHPAQVLSRDGDQEQDLIQKAKDLVITFEDALAQLTPHNSYIVSPTQQETVSLAHSAFVTAFDDWKARDSSVLIETMVATFVSLDAIWQTVKDDHSGDVKEDYRQGIRDNQVRLLSRIHKLAGHERGSLLIKKAIRESRRTRQRRKPIGDFRPRPAAELAAGAASSAQAVSAATNIEAAAAELAQPQDITPEDSLDVADAFGKLFSTIPDNRILVHELAIDKDYRIDMSPHSDFRDALNQQICSAMRNGFERGDGTAWTLAMAHNVRGKLLQQLKNESSIKTLISDTLDPVLIRNQCEQGMFSYPSFFSFMATILPKLCAPFRDDEVRTLVDILRDSDDSMDAMFDKLFRVLHMIDLISLDYTNFLVTQIAPRLIGEADGYERKSFAQDLESGKSTLSRTKRWWSNAAVNVLTEGDRRDPLNRPSDQKIYARGLVDLAIATTPLRDEDLPETLALDRARIRKLREDSLRITTIAAILLTAKGLLKRDVRSQWKPEAARMLDALKDGFEKRDEENNDVDAMPAKILTIIESGHAMPSTSKAQLASTITRLLSHAASGRIIDPVTKVLFGRLKQHIFTRLSASTSPERVRVASTAGEGLATSGLAEFIGQVGDVVDLLARMSDVDRKAHGSWYAEVAGEVERAGLEEERSAM